MSDTTAKIRAKGLDSTGVTEEIANQMYAHKGKHYMAIVEVVVDERHEKAEGKKRVDLVLEQFEPALDDTISNYLRELTRTLHLNRAHADGQLAIDQSLDDEPTVEGVVAAGGRFTMHPFLPDDAAKDTPLCDVCGLVQNVGVHQAQVDDPFEIPDHGQDELGDDEAAADGLEVEEPATVG